MTEQSPKPLHVLKVARTFIENEPEQFGIYSPRTVNGFFNGDLVALCPKEADAVLFAAAPELLGALKAIMQTGFILNAPPCTCKARHSLPHDCAICRARQAIAKATGESR